MHKLDDFKVWFMLSIASLLVPLAYEFRQLNEAVLVEYTGFQIPPIIIAVILFVFGLTVAKYVAEYLIKKRIVRRWILGSLYVEGYWLLRTTIKNGNAGSLNNVGIAFMSYKTGCREFKIETTRFDGERRYVTQSEVGYVRTSGSTIRYLNFFSLTHPNPNGLQGFSSGRFSYGDHFSKWPQYFDAIIAVQDGQFSGGQFAERITDEKVEEYHINHQEKWMQKYIEEYGDFKGPDKAEEFKEDMDSKVAEKPA